MTYGPRDDLVSPGADVIVAPCVGTDAAATSDATTAAAAASVVLPAC